METINTRTRLSRRATLKMTGAAGLAALIGQPHLRTVVAQSASPPAESEAVVIVGDVEDFALEPEGRWEGGFGSVTMRMHRGF